MQARTILLSVVVSSLLLTTTACSDTNSSSSSPNAPASSTPIAQGDLDAATLDYLKANAAAFADQLGIADPPSIQPIRLIALNEWAATQISCLQDAGFDVTETPDGQGIAYPQLSDAGLKQSLNLAVYTCEMQYPTQQKYSLPLSTKSLEVLYAYRTGQLLQCLKDQGYGSSTKPPSETVFVQSNGEWTPFSDLAIAEGDLKRVYSSCPQTPDSVYGN
ncbi:hypothetical protein [Subtercola boreus]|uniref:hypothetical protein n=1 Tax=Subtercola boreus TaxID=120213 RepID=UPI0011C061F9|nr:hypothetical protein [Subtercola boreus]